MRVSVVSSPSIFRLFCACYMHFPIHAPFSYFNTVIRVVREDPYLNNNNNNNNYYYYYYYYYCVLLFTYVHCFKQDILHVQFWLVTKNK
jgi:hypothetical protein